MAGYAAKYLKQLAEDIPTLLRNRGHDHFFVHSVSMVAHRSSIKLRQLYEMVSNATLLTVEIFPVVHKYLRKFKFIQPVPMVSMYHWQRKNSIPALESLSAARTTLISFFGSASTG
jgi:hypothetical protein